MEWHVSKQAQLLFSPCRIIEKLHLLLKASPLSFEQLSDNILLNLITLDNNINLNICITVFLKVKEVNELGLMANDNMMR